MKCIICKKEIDTKSDKKDQIHCPLCHSEYPKRFTEKLITFEEMKENIKKGEKIEMAPQVLTSQYEDIANHFIPKVCNIKRFVITDESSLLDFNSEIEEEKRETDKALEKIKSIYGVDVSDVEKLNLIKIFERLRILSSIFN